MALSSDGYMFRLDSAIYSVMRVRVCTFQCCTDSMHSYHVGLFLLYFSLLLFFFFLMIAGPCLSLSISNPWSSWHLPCLVQRWHSPLQRPPSLRPVRQTARCRSTRCACRRWHECRIERRPLYQCAHVPSQNV